MKPGFAFWPKAQQYRHIIPANPERRDLQPQPLRRGIGRAELSREQASLVAVLNSTLVGLFKTFYGRFAGTEGNLKTEVVDVNLLEVPDPRGVSPNIAKRLTDALERMGKREVGRLVEEQLMDCHSPERAGGWLPVRWCFRDELQQPDRRDLDDAVFELLGVSDANERDELIGRLYEATARHFRDIRVVEIEKMEQRAKSDSKRFRVDDLAADIWDAAELEDATPLAEWVGQQPESDSLAILLDERPATLSEGRDVSPRIPCISARERKGHIDCQSRGQAELVVRLANLGVHGQVKLPAELGPCLKVLERVDRRVERARARFKELAESRTGDERVQEQLIEVARTLVCRRPGNSQAGRGSGN